MQAVLAQVLDLGGTFVFALSGGAAGGRRGMDLFGVLVLAFACGNAGGMARDILIGAVPPSALVQRRYLAVSVLAGGAVFVLPHLIEQMGQPVLWFDAVGLAFCAVVGAEKARHFGLRPMMAALLGMVGGIGGGMTRDVLSAQVPVVLRADLYAVAALSGALVVAYADVLRLPRPLAAALGAAACLVLRFGAIEYGWHLPHG